MLVITITEQASDKLKRFMEKERRTNPNIAYVRLYVRGGGCRGYQYGIAFETAKSEHDTIIEYDGIIFIADSQSAALINGAKIDYHDSLEKSGFIIQNPNAKSTCGCGGSFNV